MKKWWHRICSLILVIAMMVNFLPLNALAEWDQGEDSSLTASNDAEELELQQDEAYESSKIVNENIDGRTEFSKEFRMDSGVSMAVVYGSPVHYEKDGKWEEIDNTLKVNSNNTITNTAGVWDVSFPQRLSGANQIQITKNGYTLSFGMGGELRNQGNLEIMSEEPVSESLLAETEPVDISSNTESGLEETEPTETVSVELIIETVELVQSTAAMTVIEETDPEELEPEASIPEETATEETILEETEPEVTASVATEAEVTVPEETEPEPTVPENTTPEETVPEATATEEPSSEETEPEETESAPTVPEETIPETVVPEVTVPKETVAVNIVPSLPTTSVNIDGISQTFAINAAKLSQGQIQKLDYKKALDATEYKETVLIKPVSQLMYEEVYSNTDIKYNLIGNQVKESIILQSYDSNLRGYQFALNTGDLIPVLEEDGHIDLYDPSMESIVMTMPAPYLQDNKKEYCDDIRVVLSGSDGKYVLTYMLPLQWLADSERSWPVVLDPIVSASTNVNNIQDTTVGSKYSYGYLSGVLEAGVCLTNGVQRFFVKYAQLPELSSADVIVGAMIRMYNPDASSEYKTVEVHKVKETWESYSVTWNNQPGFDPIVEDYVRSKNEDFYFWDITDIVRGWYIGENTGMMFKAPDEDEANTSVKSWEQFYSSDFGVDISRPNLFIFFRNNNGLEGYWDYTSSSAGRAGTGHINQYSGNLVWVHNDIGFGGNRMPVSINHIYNTNDKSNEQFGVGTGWRTNFNQRIYKWSENNLYYIWEDADGTKHYFENESYGVFKDEDGLELTLNSIATSESVYCLTDKNGNKSHFDGKGRLIKQTNNQKTKSNIHITYTTSSGYAIDTITDGAGRVYDFEYSDDLLSRIVYKGKSPGAAELSWVSYGYTGSDLTSIQYKDGESTSFTYDSNHLMTTATDIDGYELRYTYNTTVEGQPSRVSSVSEFDGSVSGGSLSFEYAHNQTTLTDNNDNTQILQFNDFGNTVAVQDGEGHAQYAKYAKNDSEETGKGNQLTASSKMQNTVSNLLADSSFENNVSWTNGTVSGEIKDGGYLGSKYMLVTNRTVKSPSFIVAAGESCTFSAYVTASGTGGVLALHSSEGAVATYSIPACNEWTRVQVNYTNTTEDSQILCAAVQSIGSQEVSVDCVQVEKGPTASRYNLVQNGDFRVSGTPAQGWTDNDLGDADVLTTLESSAAPQLDTTVMKIVGDSASAKSISQDIPVSGAAGDTYVVTGWALANAVPFKEENQPDGETREFGIRLTFHNTDGTTKSEVAQFNTATNTEANWQYSSAVAVAEKDYSSVTVEAVYDYNANTAYFDGIQLYKEEFSQSYTYDDDGNVISVVDLQKQKTKYEYTDNDLTKQTLPSGAELTYTYDDYHNVLTATTEKGVEYKFEYDDYGNNTSVEIIENGVSIKSTAAYSDDGNCMVSATDATGKITQYGYNANTNILEWVQYPEDEEATRTNYEYDSMYRMATAAATTDTGLALSAEYTYTDDLLTSIQTPRSTYSFSYGDFALRSNVKIGNRTLASYSYAENNHYLSSLDYGNNDRVKYEYDDLGRVTKQTYEDGDTVEYLYDNNGALATVMDSASGRTTTYYYDFLDRMMKYVESGEGYSHSVGYEYDTINNLNALVETINGTQYTTAYQYDLDNRVKSVASGLRTEASAIDDAVIKDYSYDDFGRVEKQETSKYNGDYTPPESETKPADGEGTTQQAEPAPDPNKTVLKTDSFNFTAQNSTSTSSQISEHTIDAAGYDKEFTYTYDDNGNILTISDGTNTTSYVYDSANQLLRENNQAGGFTHTWDYDSAGNIQKRYEYAYTTGELSGDPVVVDYEYTDASWGELLTVRDGQNIYTDTIGNPLSDGTWSYYWQHGRQLARIAGMGEDGYISTEFTYNADGIRTQKEVTSYELVDVGTRDGLYLCSDGEIRYFENGEPIYAGLVQDEHGDYYYINSSKTAVRGKTYWAWNNNGLLPAENYVFGTDGRIVFNLNVDDNGEFITGLRVDPDGEIRYYQSGMALYAGLIFEDGHYYYINSQLKAVRNCTYTISKTNDLMPVAEYTFDENGWMVDPPAQEQAQSRAAARAATGYQVWVPDETVTYTYVYNGDKLSQMTVGSDTLTFIYDASGTPMAVQYNNANYYYVTNIQGDVIAILNGSGTAVVEYTYDSWGDHLSITGSMASSLGKTNPLRYRGYVFDQEYNLYYLSTRYYNPEVGRFLNVDRFLSAGQGILGSNMFAYCLNNPTNYLDSLGTRCVAANRDMGGSISDQGIIEDLIDAMTDPREDSLTYSVGFSTSTSWGGTTGGASCCISVDNTYNYAAQKTDTVGASSSFGVGSSVGFNISFTNANNVQDLSGVSTSTGFTMCNGVGISVDWITFVPASDPSATKHGISIGICIGTEYEIHTGESYTISTNSWNPLRKLKELF